MQRTAGPEETAACTEGDLSRILHPSYGLPGRLVVALVGEARPTAAAGDPAPPADVQLAEVVRIDDYPRFLEGRPARRRTRH